MNTRKFLFATLALAVMPFFAMAQSQNIAEDPTMHLSGTSIMVGKKASADGSVITSHTCDGMYRTWMTMTPAHDYNDGECTRRHHRIAQKCMSGAEFPRWHTPTAILIQPIPA